MVTSFRQGYRVTVRRLQLDKCCNYLVISCRSGQPEYRYPKRLQSSPFSSDFEELLDRPLNRPLREVYYANGMGDVLEFSEPVITVSLSRTAQLPETASICTSLILKVIHSYAFSCIYHFFICFMNAILFYSLHRSCESRRAPIERLLQ